MVFALNILHDVDVDYKTVVFGRFRTFSEDRKRRKRDPRV